MRCHASTDYFWIEIFMQELPILIVDDDTWMQRILAKIVASYGFTPYFASNGFDGVAMAIDLRPVVVLLDVLMPELSGHQTLHLLKRIGPTKDIPVVMVSSVSDVGNISLSIKAGASGFIGKPFTRATIFDKIRDILGKDIIAQAALRTEAGEAAPLPEAEAVAESFAIADAGGAVKQKSAAAAPQAISQHYKEDDRKNIEAIKDLLQKRK
ncbi:hypothetical protein MASR2M18_08000 [Ignavibacteria bacterium]|nr:response regulator [Bacteroidota bacterium]MCZ2132929.1 response regulator [Bacteroidota bacterium]